MESAAPERRALGVRMNDFGFAYLISAGSPQKDIHDGTGRQVGCAATHEAAETHVLSGDQLLKFLSLSVRALQLERYTQPDAHLASTRIAGGLYDLAEARSQGIEANGLLEIPGSAELFAMFFGLSAGLPAHDNYGDQLRGAKRCEGLKQ